MTVTERGNGLQDAESDEARLLCTGDHRNVDAGFVARSIDELVAALGLAHGTGRDGSNLGAAAGGHSAESGQRADAAFDRVRREPLHVTRAGAEAHHFLVAVEDVEAVVARWPGDDEMDGVRADVDRCDRPVVVHAPV